MSKKPRIDRIASPADSLICIWLAIAGDCNVIFLKIDSGDDSYSDPKAMVPYGSIELVGRHSEICALAKAGERGKLIYFMSVWEMVFPDRPVPNLPEN